MYFFAQTTTSAVSRPGGFEKRWIESVVSCRVVEEVKSFLLKSCSWHLLGNRGSDQQRNLNVAPLSSRCSWCWRPPVTMCTVRRQFIGSLGCGNSGRSWHQVLFYCLLAPPGSRNVASGLEKLCHSWRTLKTIISISRRLNKSQRVNTAVPTWYRHIKWTLLDHLVPTTPHTLRRNSTVLEKKAKC